MSIELIVYMIAIALIEVLDLGREGRVFPDIQISSIEQARITFDKRALGLLSQTQQLPVVVGLIDAVLNQI